MGNHLADAGSEPYDRDFALKLLSQESDALYEIDDAINRIDLGTYGICEMSGNPIAQVRLEAIPFARYTVECQSQIENWSQARSVSWRPRMPARSSSDEERTHGSFAEPCVDRLPSFKERSQELLSDLTRKFLKSAEWLIAQMPDEPGFDWSCAVIPLCKGFENEIHERVLVPLREESKKEDLSKDTTDKDIGRVAKFCTGRAKPPEMGTFAYFLSTAINSEKRRESSSLIRVFFKLIEAMAGHSWLISSDGLRAALKTLTEDYRNPAAHLDALPRETFQECRDFLIGENGILWVFVIATRRVNTCRCSGLIGRSVQLHGMYHQIQ